MQQPLDQPLAGRMALPGQRDCSRRVDLIVERSGDSSSSASGSTRRSNAVDNVGSAASARRARHLLAVTARDRLHAIEFVDTPRHRRARRPGPRATDVIPPCPASRASTAIDSRRCRSSSTGASSANLRDTVDLIGGRHHITQRKARIRT